MCPLSTDTESGTNHISKQSLKSWTGRETSELKGDHTGTFYQLSHEGRWPRAMLFIF